MRVLTLILKAKPSAYNSCTWVGKESYALKRSKKKKLKKKIEKKARNQSRSFRRWIKKKRDKPMEEMKEGIDIKGYMILYRPESPYSWSNGFIYEHRLTVMENIGRKLSSSEHVHHVNKNKLDNRIRNLKIMSDYSHYKHHLTEKYLPKGKRGSKPLPEGCSTVKIYSRKEIEGYESM